MSNLLTPPSRLAPLCLACLLGSPAIAHAQAVTELDAVTVTGETFDEIARAREALSEVPGGTNVVDMQQVEQGRVAGVADVLAYQPGVYAQSPGNEGVKISIRGSGINRGPGAHASGNHILLDGLPLMVYRCRNNRHWSMEYVSAGCLELTGHAPQALVDSQSLTFNSLIHPQDRERVWRRVQEGVRAARPFAFDYRLLCADGSEKAVSERGRGIYSDLGDLLGLEGVVMQRDLDPACVQEIVAGFY